MDLSSPDLTPHTTRHPSPAAIEKASRREKNKLSQQDYRKRQKERLLVIVGKIDDLMGKIQRLEDKTDNLATKIDNQDTKFTDSVCQIHETIKENQQAVTKIVQAQETPRANGGGRNPWPRREWIQPPAGQARAPSLSIMPPYQNFSIGPDPMLSTPTLTPLSARSIERGLGGF
ncbi:hypothetical protein FE257_002190 [Aspergillus nanangensis]|uniref:BZIP domain-containing protein n=1 Tax=Aspergillus nanangensis TaxID=2582783 RepID=A0AAD4CCZ7_ASPNN|nr:hypothetical protein FE257_002190 [Aspergillus nanangensis]